MKLLRIEPAEKWDKLFTLHLTFNEDAKTLTGTVGTSGYLNEDLILDVNIDLTKWVGKLAEVRIVMTDRGYEVITVNPLKNYSIGNGMPEVADRRSSTRHRVFRIFVKPNIADSFIQVIKPHEAIEGFENIVEDGNPSLRMYNFVRRDPDLRNFIALMRLKCNMLGAIDQRDSMSYLEAQVDILTRIVLDLVSDRKDELAELLRKANTHSVLDVKSVLSLEEEFATKKAKVREVQKDYYEGKQALKETVN